MKFVTVYRTMNEIEAGMVRDFLQDQGISSTISSDIPAAVYGLSTQEVEVQANAADAERALELVEAYFSSEPLDIEGSDPPASEQLDSS